MAEIGSAVVVVEPRPSSIPKAAWASMLQEKGGTGDTPDPRQKTQGESHTDPRKQEAQAMPIENDQQGATCRMKHVHFHDRPSLESFVGSGRQHFRART